MAGRSLVVLALLCAVPSALTEVTIITTCTQLQNIQSSGNYSVGTPINCKDTRTWNSGMGFIPISEFTGNFDGNNLPIDELYINNDEYTGLFGQLLSSAIVANLLLENVEIHGGSYSGCVAGRNYGTVVNCQVNGTIDSSSHYVGGIVGRNYGSISNSQVIITITGYAYDVGGIVGSNRFPGHIDRCHAVVTISGDEQIGALAGSHYHEAIISNSHAEGVILEHYDFCSSAIGWSPAGTIVINSYSIASGCSGFAQGCSSDSFIGCFLNTDIVSGWGCANLANTIEMQREETYRREGWDFFGVWYMPIEGETYPQLRTSRISTCEQLQYIALTGKITLLNDIDCSDFIHPQNLTGFGFLSLGGYDGLNQISFNGTFDGQGFTVFGLAINRPDEDDVALFRYLSASARIINVNFENLNITGRHFVASVVAINYGGTIENVHVAGSVSGQSVVGGIVAEQASGSTFSSSTANVDVIATGDDAGGAVAIHGGTISNVNVTGSATSPGGRVGGLVGKALPGSVMTNTHANDVTVNGGRQTGGAIGLGVNTTLTDCSATGMVRGTDAVGGFAGELWNSPFSHYVGQTNVTGNSNVGGLIGTGGGYDLHDIVLTSTVSGRDRTGGLAGSGSFPSIVRCDVTAQVVTTGSSIGGLLGETDTDISVIDTMVSGSVSGPNDVGGFFGKQHGSLTVTTSHVVTDVTGQENTGGFVGDAEAVTLFQSSYRGTLNGGLNTGGVCGRQQGFANITCSSVDSTSITGWNNTGALIGLLNGNALLDEDRVTAQINADYYGGGLVGDLQGDATITHSNITTTLIAKDCTGGVAGRSLGNTIVRNCLINGDVSGWDHTGGIFGSSLFVTLEDTTFDGMVTGLHHVGAAVGESAGTAERVIINANITGVENVGAFAGTSRFHSMLSCDITAQVAATGDRAGGVAGSHEGDLTANDITFTGSLLGLDNVGGFSGEQRGDVSITNSHIDADITGQENTGGFIGDAQAPTLFGCSYHGNVNGGNNTGGFFGRQHGNMSATTSHVTANILGQENTGGFIGDAQAPTLFDCNYFGSVTGGNNTGGFFGHAESATIEQSFAEGPIKGFHNTGGLIGLVQYAVLRSCTCDCSATGINYVGGIVGRGSGLMTQVIVMRGGFRAHRYVGSLVGLSAFEISDSYSIGAVVYATYGDGGGLLGRHEAGAVENSFTFCNVFGGEDVGGFVGSHVGGTISHCTASGDASGTLNVGAFVGKNEASIIYSHSSGNSQGESSIGSFAGSNSHDIINCNASGTAAGIKAVGGFCGINEDNGWINDCLSTGNATAEESTGGCVGENSGRIDGCTSTGAVTGSSSAGGSIGFNAEEGFAMQLFAKGDVIGNENVGGSIGNNLGTVRIVRALGNVQGENYVSALFGKHAGSAYICYSAGTVEGSGIGVGGLAGETNGLIENCFTTSVIRGGVRVGGLGGIVSSGATFRYTFAVNCISGQQSGGLAGSVGSGVSFIESSWDKKRTGQEFAVGAGQKYDLNQFGYGTGKMQSRKAHRNWNETLWIFEKGQYPRLALLVDTLPELEGCPVGDPYGEWLNIALFIIAGLWLLMMLRTVWKRWHWRQWANLLDAEKDRRFHHVACIGDPLLLTYLSEHSALLDTVNERDETPLVVAAKMGHLAMVTRFIELAAENLNKQQPEEALRRAAARGHQAIVDLLKTQPCCSQHSTMTVTVQHTDLHKAAKKGSLKEAKKAMKSVGETFRDDFVNRINAEGQTALFLATQAGHFDVAAYLIEQGAGLFVPVNYDNSDESPTFDTALTAAIVHPDARIWIHQNLHSAGRRHYWRYRFALTLQAVRDGKLATVNLRGCGLNDVQVADLLEAIQAGDDNVTYLDLSCNDITSAGAKLIAKWKTEHSSRKVTIHLDHNLIGKTGIAVFQGQTESGATVTLDHNKAPPKLVSTDADSSEEGSPSPQKSKGKSIPLLGAMPHVGGLPTWLWIGLQWFQIETLLTFTVEIGDKFLDLLLLLRLEKLGEYELAQFSMLSLLLSYAVAFVGLYIAHAGRRPRPWYRAVGWFALLPVWSPEIVPLKLGIHYVYQKFAWLKLSNFVLEDMMQFMVSLIFLQRKGTDTVVILRVMATLLFSIAALLKVWFYDLPQATRRNIKALLQQWCTRCWRRASGKHDHHRRPSELRPVSTNSGGGDYQPFNDT